MKSPACSAGRSLDRALSVPASPIHPSTCSHSPCYRIPDSHSSALCPQASSLCSPFLSCSYGGGGGRLSTALLIQVISSNEISDSTLPSSGWYRNISSLFLPASTIFSSEQNPQNSMRVLVGGYQCTGD